MNSSKIHKIGTVTPTCSPERKELLDFVLKRIKEEQTMAVDYVCVVDYPNKSKRPDLTARYVQGIKECFDNGCDFVLFIEDDDYYPKTYVEDMYRAWLSHGKPALIGANVTNYYHLFSYGIGEMKPKTHSSAHGTGLGKKALYDVCDHSNPFYDMALWKANRDAGKNCVLFDMPNHCISIKHGFGLVGGRGHLGKEYRKFDDKRRTQLRKWVDKEAFDFYTSFYNKHKYTHPVHKLRAKDVRKEEKQREFQEKAHYDKVFSELSEYMLSEPNKSIYYQVWRTVARWIHSSEKIVELGCGIGLCAKYLFECGKNYQRGVDFSDVAIKRAKELNPDQQNKFRVMDLRGFQQTPVGYTVLILEVLEHLEDDVSVLRKLPMGARVVFSVPDFMCDGHVRCFKSIGHIKAHYPMLEINRTREFKITSNNTIFLCDARRKEEI